MSIMLVNEPRKKQPYLVNPFNPWRKVSVPKHEFAVWQDKKTHRFAKAPEWAKKTKRAFKKKHHIKLSKSEFLERMNKGRKKAGLSTIKAKGHKTAKKSTATKRKSHKKGLTRLGMAPVAFKHFMKKYRKMPKHLKEETRYTLHQAGFKLQNPNKGAFTMKRKSHRRHNPFSIKGFSKGIIDTNMLIDTGVAGVGLMATNFAMGFASSKVAILSTPVGKTVGKLVLAFLFKKGGDMAKQPRYGKALAVGATLSAIQDVYEFVLPKLGYTGSVRLLENGVSSGYMPDSVGDGYMPDSVGNGYMPGTVGEGSYGFSE